MGSIIVTGIQLFDRDAALAEPISEAVPYARNSNYIYMATLAAFVWDILTNIGEEASMFQTFALTWPQIGYIVSRFSSLLAVLLAFIYGVGSVSNCQQILITIGSLLSIATPANSFLMYIRARSVYSDSRAAKTLFTLLWLSVLCASVTGPIAARGEHMGDTHRCIAAQVHGIAAIGPLFSGINDTLIFLAISYRLLAVHDESDRWSDRLKSFFSGDSMHKTARLLLHTGQLYYGVTAGMNLFAVITMMSTHLAQSPLLVTRPTFASPNVALTNVMTCTVFRRLRLGLLDEDSFSTVHGLSAEYTPHFQSCSTNLEARTYDAEESGADVHP